LQTWYTWFLSRQPDPTGSSGFVAALQSQVRDEQIIAAIVGSDEYFNKLQYP
jgi:hypothetical protein